MLQSVIINRIHTFGVAFTHGGAHYRMNFLFTGGWANNWGAFKSGRVFISGGLIIECIFLFTGSWANNWGAFKWGLLYPSGSSSNIYFVSRKIG